MQLNQGLNNNSIYGKTLFLEMHSNYTIKINKASSTNEVDITECYHIKEYK